LKPKVFIFGAGDSGNSVFNRITPNSNILGFIDNSKLKQNTTYLGKQVFGPEILSNMKFEYVVIASMYEHEIYHQLMEQGIEPDKLVLSSHFINSRYFPWESIILLLFFILISISTFLALLFFI
jgi:FlaA1/EpsC-like NDP-sugar epimerase